MISNKDDIHVRAYIQYVTIIQWLVLVRFKRPPASTIEELPHLLDQTPLSITHRYRIIVAQAALLEEIDASLEY